MCMVSHLKVLSSEVKLYSKSGVNQQVFLYARCRELWMIYRGPGFLDVVYFRSSPTSFPDQQARTVTHRKTEKKRQLADGIGGGGWWTSHLINDSEQAWPFVNQSILSRSRECWLKHSLVPVLKHIVLSLKGAQAWEFFARVFCTNQTHMGMWLGK